MGIIRSELVRALGDKVRSAVLYGTAISDDFSSVSDFDVLLSFDKVDSTIILALRNVIKSCAECGIVVDFNVHSYEEMPQNSHDEFWHNNRGLIFQKEISLFGRAIIGENQYSIHLPSVELVRQDIRRHVSGLVYRGRKIMINTHLTRSDKYNLIKFVLYAIANILEFHGIYLQNRQEFIDAFHDKFPDFGDVQHYLDLKRNPHIEITDEDAFSALSLLERISSYLYSQGTNSQSQ